MIHSRILIACLALGACAAAPAAPSGGTPATPRPDWVDRVPQLGDGRAYFVGVAEGVDADARARAYAAAEHQVSSAVVSHVRGVTQMRHGERLGNRDSWSSEISHAAETYTDAVLVDFRVEQQWREGDQRLYLLTSFPAAQLRPTAAVQSATLARVATHSHAAGDLQRAARLWWTAYLLQPDRRTGELLLRTLTELSAPARGLDLIVALRSDFPDHAATWDDERRALQAQLDERLAASSWDRAIASLVATFEAHRDGRAFRFSLHRDQARPFRGAEPPPADETLPCSIRSEQPVWLTLLWIDSEGLYYALDFLPMAGGLQRHQLWNEQTRIPSATVTGDVTVLALATTDEPALEFEPLLRGRIDSGDRKELARLLALVDSVQSCASNPGTVTDVARFRVRDPRSDEGL